MTEGVVETGSAGIDEKGTDAGIFWIKCCTIERLCGIMKEKCRKQ